jgi:hypothetical protein
MLSAALSYQEACLLPAKLVSSGARFWFNSTESKTKQAPPCAAGAKRCLEACFLTTLLVARAAVEVVEE